MSGGDTATMRTMTAFIRLFPASRSASDMGPTTPTLRGPRSASDRSRVHGPPTARPDINPAEPVERRPDRSPALFENNLRTYCVAP